MELLHREERVTPGLFSQVSVPATHTHLMLRLIIRSASTTASENTVGLRFNGDTGANYNAIRKRWNANGHSTSGDDGQHVTYASIGFAPGENTGLPAADHKGHRIDVHIPFYQSGFWKGWMGKAPANNFEFATDPTTNRSHGVWENTAVITALDVFLGAGAVNFHEGSILELWGM